MKITRVIALAVIVGSTSGAMAQAQNLRNADEPAEFPPSSYKATQYIDSRGCVYVRAGIGGNVSWIPRVSRSRNQICGQTPSIASAVASAAPEAKAADKPVQITLDAPKKAAPVATAVAKPAATKPAVAKATVRKPVVAAAKPRRVKIARPVAVPKPVVAATVAKPVVVAAVAKPVVAPPVKRKVVKVQPKAAPVASVCPGVSATGQSYLGRSNSGLAVRCGPQTQAHARKASAVRATTAPRAAAVAQPTRRVVTNRRPQAVASARNTTTIDGSTRIVPKHVLANRQNTQNLPIPNGYRPVWTDDRLNPHRAEQSLAGQAQIKLVWTKQVPRRLINTANGRDVTATTPLVYPYVDTANQTRNLGKVTIVTRDGKVLKRIVRNVAAAKVRQPVVSSRSAPVTKPAAPKAVAQQFVNVGTYLQQGSAQTVAKRIQRMGLPVRVGKFTRSGQTLRVVVAGPFGAEASQTLAKLRSSGYPNASLR